MLIINVKFIVSMIYNESHTKVCYSSFYMDKHQKGQLGEDIAQKHLQKQGFKVLERGFRCKLGEIDLIAKKGHDLYFVEVKTRWSDNCGDPLEAITQFKQRQIIKTAKFYLAKKRLFDVGCHLSAIGVNMSGTEPKFDFIEDAFTE